MTHRGPFQPLTFWDSVIPVSSGWAFWGWLCSRKRWVWAGISSVPVLAAHTREGARAHPLVGSPGGPTSLARVPCHCRAGKACDPETEGCVGLGRPAAMPPELEIGVRRL